ncbi:ryanodine receptor 1-like [Tachysurus ichikawai]
MAVPRKLASSGRLRGGGADAERAKKKRRGDRYSVQTSLIVAALKKLLPIGLNMCSPADQELINLAKIRYSLTPQECSWLPSNYVRSLQGGGADAERAKKKRRGDRYSVQTSLIVAALKKLLPIGLNMCSPADQELINLAKIRYSLVKGD